MPRLPSVGRYIYRGKTSGSGTRTVVQAQVECTEQRQNTTPSGYDAVRRSGLRGVCPPNWLEWFQAQEGEGKQERIEECQRRTARQSLVVSVWYPKSCVM